MRKEVESDNSREEERKDNIELISLLKGIIAQQELKISQLEKDLKKWQKKYKEEFFKESKYSQSSQYQKEKQYKISFQTFSRDLSLLQARFDKNNDKNILNNNSNPLQAGLQLIQKLYHQLQRAQNQKISKNSLIREQQEKIVKGKTQLQTYLKQYSIAVKKSEDYQDKLLSEIKRQQKIINRLKQ